MKRVVKIFVLSAILISGQSLGSLNSDRLRSAAKSSFFAFSAVYGMVACGMKAVKNYNRGESLEFKLYAGLLAAASVGCGIMAAQHVKQSWSILKSARSKWF